MNDYLVYSLVMIIAGVGIPIMAVLNGGLGSKLGNPAIAVVILLLVSLLVTIVYLFMTSGVPAKINFKASPWYFYLGGVFFMFYILNITRIAPHFGISNAVSFVLLGQLIAMSVIDHYGHFGADQYSLDTKRVVGLLLMAVGVFMVLSKSSAPEI